MVLTNADERYVPVADTGTPSGVTFKGRWREAPKLPVFILTIVVFLALFGPLFAPHDPVKMDLGNSLLPPVGITTQRQTFEGFETVRGTWEHSLGTDSIGRDILSRLIYGTRYSLGIAALAMILGAFLGTAVGLVSGYFGGWTDRVIMRVVDVLFSFPIILLALLLAVVRGPGFGNVVFAVSFILWTRFARVVRGETQALRDRDFVVQARINNVSTPRIMLHHILPNILPTLTVLISLQLGWIILIEASLSFLGAGLPPTIPAWGVMIDSGQRVLREAWWVATIPGIAIMLVVLAFNVLGDWMRDVFDPHLSHQR